MDAEVDISNPFSTDSTGLGLENNVSFMTAEEEILSLLGSPRDALTTVIPMTLVYVMILMTGLIGNLCTCFVIIKNRYMHTTVNFYLFSLAISDLLLLIVGLPAEMWAFWQKYPYVFGETFCVLRALISEACSYASVLTITAFTVERYIAICHPLKAHTMAQLPRAIKAIILIWIVATLSSVPISLQLGIIYQVICLLSECHCLTSDCRSDLAEQQEATDCDGTVCSQKPHPLSVHDLDHRLLRPAHDADPLPVLPDRAAAEAEFAGNGAYIGDAGLCVILSEPKDARRLRRRKLLSGKQ